MINQPKPSGKPGQPHKQSDAAELLRGIREAAAGRRYLAPPLSERAVEAYARRARGVSVDAYETLTVREQEVLRLTAEGLTAREVARRLYLSPRTVETHRANLMGKLGLRNQTELVRYAIGRGIVEPNP